MDMFSLKDKVCFVTGAGSGIGQRIAIGLARAGGNVACFDRNDNQGIADTVKEIEASGRKAVKVIGDVTKKDSLEASLQIVDKELGNLDIAVNCAGIANANPAEEMEESQWDSMIEINLKGIFLSCQAEAQRMLKKKSGSIVNIASMSGVIVNRGLQQVHYNSSKAGVIHLTKSFAMEWVERGVRVNAISPGYISTPMNLRPEMKDIMAEFAASTPMQRIGSPDEIVGPAIFLSSEAASFCTGVNLLVDGGYCCW